MKNTKTKKTLTKEDKLLKEMLEGLAKALGEAQKRQRVRLFWKLALSFATIFTLVTASLMYVVGHYEEAIFFLFLTVLGAIITRTESI